MKLNRKIVGALALITLGVAVVGAGTFAKYTSEVEVLPNTARLAKYQFNQTGTFDLFATSYAGNVVGENTVAAKNSADKVVAPGTTATSYINFASDSEVKTETVVNLTGVEVTDPDGQGASDVLLHHIKLTVSINGATASDKTLAEIKTALATPGTEVRIGGATVIDAGVGDTIAVPVKWTYGFEGDATYDAADTAAASGATMPTVLLTFTGINTQID